MTINIETMEILKGIIEFALAVIAIGGIGISIIKWVLRQSGQDKDIQKIKKENSLLVEGLMACLDGLEQLGANHTVPKAKQQIQDYLNEQAHDIDKEDKKK